MEGVLCTGNYCGKGLKPCPYQILVYHGGCELYGVDCDFEYGGEDEPQLRCYQCMKENDR